MMSEPTAPGRIDVHAHFIPDFYRERALAAGITQPDGMPGWPAWSEAAALAAMDSLGIQTAILSISSPGLLFGDLSQTSALARRVNEAGAALVRTHPTRFGLFAALPLPDVAAALVEVRYAYDTLGADGIVLLTNYQGTYPGDAALDPLLAALAARRAVVFLHPTAPPNVAQVTLGYPAPLLEFMFETTRTVTHLLLQRVPQRYPGIRWIVPHAGAALPVLLDRVVGQAGALHLPAPGAELLAAFPGLYFDLAGTPLPRTLPALRTLSQPTHLLYGTDYCFASVENGQQWQQKIDPDLAAHHELEAVMRRNAEQLFPRLAAPPTP